MKTISSFLFLAGTAILMSFTFASNVAFNQDKWVAPASSKEIKNSFTGDASIAKGKSIYQTRCVVCHGTNGYGDGPAGKTLTPQAANHTEAYVQNQTDGELFWKISEGRGAMVGWKLILSEEDRWAVVNYIRTLAK
ncbi:MAG: cytochrome c [Cyclobacteriaceae bacterium]|nr:cytochrome c [Cyclobacteriaceae bacterium]